jgi:hypothetical protein
MNASSDELLRVQALLTWLDEHAIFAVDARFDMYDVSGEKSTFRVLYHTDGFHYVKVDGT